MKRISILGSTGSVGRNTLQVIQEMGEECEVVALAAGRNVDELVDQTLAFRPRLVSLADQALRDEFLEKLASHADWRGETPEALYGPEGNLAAVAVGDPDIVVSAAVGVAGLEATFEAVRRGKRVALANKEVLVAAGDLVMAAARESGAEILPVDSEHNGVHQCLHAGPTKEVSRLILTASGGPFRTLPKSEFDAITPERALDHPTWKMGARITIDSATLMNKGFEVIGSTLALRFPSRTDRSRGSSTIDRSCAARVSRRLGDRAVGAAGHEAADPLRVELSATASLARGPQAAMGLCETIRL